MREPTRPTESELAILAILWKQGPCTVRQVQEELSKQSATGYTTALKLLQIMLEKGLVGRDETDRSHVYHSAIAQEKIQRTLLDRLMESAFGGSAPKLVLSALSSKKASPSELAEIRKLLDELERKQKGKKGKS